MVVEHSWAEMVAAMNYTVDQAIDVVADTAVARSWDEPSVLPQMTVGMLATHLGQMLDVLVTWLDDEPPDPSEVDVVAGFELYQAGRIDIHEGLRGSWARTAREWSQSGAAHGATAVVEQARHTRDRLAEQLASASPDRLIPSTFMPGKAAPLQSYLATRCVEVVVHLDDLTASAGMPTPRFDPTAVAIAVDVVVQMCRSRAGDLDVLRAFTRPVRADRDTLRAL